MMICQCCRNEDRQTAPVSGVELCDECAQFYRERVAERAALQQQLTAERAARAALVPYLQHLAECPANFTGNPRVDGEPDVCTCGLDAAIPPPADAGWRPIATAPKDMDVLLYQEGEGVQPGYWSDEHGWLAGETRGFTSGRMQPTHWQPLPDPPATQASPADAPMSTQNNVPRRRRRFVGPVHRAVFGVPEPCPRCLGQLAPTFGLTVGDDGTRRPVLDPTHAICRDCGTVFPVRDAGEG